MYCYNCMGKIADNAKFCSLCGQPVQQESAMHHLLPGTILNGKYMVGKVLGEGGFGITYVGRDLNLDMKIAIKEYYPNGYANRNNTATNDVALTALPKNDYFLKGKTRFLQEARTLAKFSHDRNVVNVRDFFELNNTAYIIMEFLEGPNLKQYLLQNGKMNAVEMVNWFVPILRVLGKIHSQGLIHRDISPDNIIVEDGNLILIDFGAAREVESNKSLSVVLKPGYAPGEQYYTHGNQGPWTDIYAICATMYKCITGVTPPESSERLFEDKLVPPSQTGVKVPQNIEAALMKGLSNRYQERQSNMEELIQELTTEAQVSVSVSECTDNAQEAGATVYVSGLTEDQEDSKTVFSGAASSNSAQEEDGKTVMPTMTQAGMGDNYTVNTPNEQKVQPISTPAPTPVSESAVSGAAQTGGPITGNYNLAPIDAPKKSRDGRRSRDEKKSQDANADRFKRKETRQSERPKKQKTASNGKKSKKGLIIVVIVVVVVVLAIIGFLAEAGGSGTKTTTTTTTPVVETVPEETTAPASGTKSGTSNSGTTVNKQDGTTTTPASSTKSTSAGSQSSGSTVKGSGAKSSSGN